MKEQLEGESNAIPLDRIKDVLSALPYADEIRVIFEFLFVTGARIAEIDHFYMTQLYPAEGGCLLYWKLGKNQKSHRKEFIPDCLVKELLAYREKNNVPANRMFGITSETFRRYFNMKVRPSLPPAWREKRIVTRKDQLQEEYKLQLKGLRKDFQTLLFAKLLEKWKDADIAIQFTSRRMRHSSKHITAYHYIVNFDDIKVKQYLHLSPTDLLRSGAQKRILDFS